MPKLKLHQVGQAGEHYVAAELHRRGAYAVTFSGNMPNIDILASDVDQTRAVQIQVKTKTAGTWHTSVMRGASRQPNPDERDFWVLVDIGKTPKYRPCTGSHRTGGWSTTSTRGIRSESRRTVASGSETPSPRTSRSFRRTSGSGATDGTCSASSDSGGAGLEQRQGRWLGGGGDEVVRPKPCAAQSHGVGDPLPGVGLAVCGDYHAHRHAVTASLNLGDLAACCCET